MRRTWWWRLLVIVLAPVWIPLMLIGLAAASVLVLVVVPLLIVGNYVATGDFDLPKWAR